MRVVPAGDSRSDNCSRAVLLNVTVAAGDSEGVGDTVSDSII